MNFIKLLSLGITLVLLFGCTSETYKCSMDQKIIIDLKESYTLSTIDDGKPFDPITYMEGFVEIVNLEQSAKKRNVQIDDLASVSEEKLYCSLKCAEKAKTIKNEEIRRNRQKILERDRQDSLTLDSIHKGLIK